MYSRKSKIFGCNTDEKSDLLGKTEQNGRKETRKINTFGQIVNFYFKE